MKYQCIRILLATWMVCIAGSATAQAWPSRPIRLLIPLAAGGATDKAARLMASRLSMALGQQVVAENVTGASGAIALQRLASSDPDGYTLAATANSLHTVAPHTSKLPYDAVAGFTMIGTYAAFEYVLVVGASSPIMSMADLIGRASKTPGLVSFGSSGVGTGNHLAGVLLGQLAGVEFNSIPYRGGSPAMMDVMGDRTDFMLDVLGSAMPLVDGGKVRALGTSGAKRSSLLPQVPSISETVPGYEANGWFALIGPPRMPPEVVTRLNLELNRLQERSDYRGELTSLGYQPLPGSPSDADLRLRTESAKWAAVVGKLPCAAIPERCSNGVAPK